MNEHYRDINLPSFEKKNFLHVLFLVALLFSVYSNSLNSPFFFDDSQITVANKGYIDQGSLSWDGLSKYLQNCPNKWRIIPNLSFAFDIFLHGEEVSGFHIVNILIHSSVSVVLYILFNIILSPAFNLINKNIIKYRSEIALVGAVIWAVHPVQTNAVTYIIQRMTSLAALFYMLSFLFYLTGKFRTNIKEKISIYTVAALFGAMAVASKENSAVLPLTIFCCEYFFFHQVDGPTRFFRRKTLLWGFLVFFSICLLSVMFLEGHPVDRILAGYKARDFTLEQRLLTEPRIIFHYLSLILLPLPSRLNLAYDYKVSTGFLAPPHTLVAILGLIFLVFLVFFLFDRHRLIAFSIFWFLVNLIIESSIIPLMLIFEHRMYLPSVFIILSIVVFMYQLGKNNIALVRCFFIAVIFLLSMFTWQRNITWNDKISLWSDVVQKSPGLSWGHVNLGMAYMNTGDYVQSGIVLGKALELDPESGFAYFNLGVLYDRQNRLAEARFAFQKALDLKYTDPAGPSILINNLALVHCKLNNLNEAVSLANYAIELDPMAYNPYDVLGVSYLKKGNLDQAEGTFLKALEIFPDNGEIYLRLGTVYEKRNRLADALTILEKALLLPEVPAAKVYNQMGIVYWRMNRYPESIAAAKRAIQEDPGLLDAYLTLGISYEDSGQRLQAFEQFTRAWQMGFDMVGMYNNWADNLLRMNKPDTAIVYLKEAVKLDPDQYKSHKNLATAYTMKGMLAESAAEMNIARQLAEGAE